MGYASLLKGVPDLLNTAGRALSRLSIKNADELAGQLMPMLLQTNDRVLVEKGINALRNMGAQVPSLPGPGLLGVTSGPRVPAPSQIPEALRGLIGEVAPKGSARASSEILPRAPKPTWENVPTPPPGSRPVNTLIPQPYQGPRTRGGALVAPERAAEATRFPQVSKTAPVAEMPPIRTSAPAPSAQVAEELGGRLDLRQGRGAEAIAPFTTSKGAVRPIGTKIGGQTYSGKPFATERNIETIASGGPRAVDEARAVNIGEPGRSMFLDQSDVDRLWGEIQIDPSLLQRMPPDMAERFVRMGAQQTPKMSPGVRAAFGVDAGSAPVDLAADRAFEIAQALRNSAAGARTMDLSGIDPRVLLALGGGASATALGTGLMMRDSGEEGSAPVGDLPTTGEAPDLPAADLTPQPQAPGLLFGDDNGQPLAPVGSRLGQVPSSPNTITTSGGIEQEGTAMAALALADPAAAAAARMLAPMSPEMYSSPKEYFAAREAYANKPAVREALATFAGSTGSSPEMEANLQTWAKANPALAYELQRRALKNDAANQQSNETMTSSAIVSPMGSNIAQNAVGNSRAVADTAFANTQGNRDMLAATHPMELPYLQRTQSFMDNALRAARMPFA